MAAIIKTGVRVFTPDEYEGLEAHITKPSLKKLVRVLLFTGMRYQEVIRLKANPTGFNPSRKVIKVRSGKKGAVYSERYVHLTPLGVEAVQEFIDDGRTTYPSPTVMMMNLITWAKRSHLTEALELVGALQTGFNKGHDRINVYGVSVKSFRKTWESWLAITNPNMLEMICLSQGHISRTSMAHYLGIPFTHEEREQIKQYTNGWMA